MPIMFKAKTNRVKLVETVKTLTQPAVKYLTAAWTLFRTHPFFRTLFTSKWSFIGILVLTPILIGFCLMLPVTHEVMGYQMESPFWAMMLKSLPGMAISALGYLAIFGFISALYLTFSGNWHLFFRWWSVGLARRKDRMASVTSSPLIVRDRLSQFDAEDGIFLTYGAALSRLSFKQRKLTFVDDRHVTVVGGTRGGKGVSFIIPNLLHHKGSVIVYDPAGENFDVTAAYRQQVLGQKIIALDPFGITRQPSTGWNPLSEIDFERDPQALDKCYGLAESLIEISGRDAYWPQSAQELLAMCCAYIGLRSVPENLHLPQVYTLLHSDDLAPLWTAMSLCENESCNPALAGIVSRYGASCLGREGKEFNGVLQTLRTALRFIATETMRDSLSDNDFSMKSLKDGKTSVYIIVPAGAGATYKGWLRLLFDGAFDAMQDMSIPKPDKPTLFLMDEFPLLGYMERIKRAAGEAAKFGVKLFICAQDINQLKEIYGDAWESFVAASGLTIMFANNDLATQQYLSAKLGKEYHAKTSTTSGANGSSNSTSYELREVARADEVARRSNRSSGTAYVLCPDMKPMRIDRAPYYLWNMIPKGLVYKPDGTNQNEESPELAQALQAAE